MHKGDNYSIMIKNPVFPYYYFLFVKSKGENLA